MRYDTMADTLGAQAGALDEPLDLAEAFLPASEPERLALLRVRAHLRAAEDELRTLARTLHTREEAHDG
jgi:hypothetical protein